MVTTTSTVGAVAAVGPHREWLSRYEGTSDEGLLEGATVAVTDTTVQLNTELFADKEAAPQAIGLCITFGLEEALAATATSG